MKTIDFERFLEDLRRMGCAGLLDVAWGVEEESVIRDIVGPVANTCGSISTDPKDSYLVRGLKDPEIRMVIGFLNSVFHPDKPKRLVSLWASTFIGSFYEKLVVDWAYLLVDLVKHLVETVQKSKSKAKTPFFVYLAHLYGKDEFLGLEE